LGGMCALIILLALIIDLLLLPSLLLIFGNKSK
jgi:predicted RND superfamily exporter protein